MTAALDRQRRQRGHENSAEQLVERVRLQDACGGTDWGQVLIKTLISTRCCCLPSHPNYSHGLGAHFKRRHDSFLPSYPNYSYGALRGIAAFRPTPTTAMARALTPNTVTTPQSIQPHTSHELACQHRSSAIHRYSWRCAICDEVRSESREAVSVLSRPDKEPHVYCH